MSVRCAESSEAQRRLAERHSQAGGDHRGCYRRVCAVCGRVFYAGLPRASLCSERCSQVVALKRRHERQRRARQRRCPRCGRMFVASRKDGVYCSNACRQAMHRRRVTADGA
jgi:predicted nucleic acid-binding Zn ribbon protein